MKLRILIVISLWVLIGCGEIFAQSSTTGDRIKIGVLQSLTGIAAEDGNTVVHALEMASDDINAAGKSKVELLIEDDGTQAKSAVTAFERLVARGADAIIGASWDFTSNPLLPIAARKQMVIFNTTTFTDALSLPEASGYGFVNAPTLDSQALPFEEYLKAHTVKSLVIVFVNNSWGEAQLKVHRGIAKKYGVNIKDELRSTSYDANEWSLLVTRVKQKDADLVLLLLNRSDLELFLRKARELGLKSSFFASQNLLDALHQSTSKNLFNGVCFTYPLAQLAKEGEFRARHKERFGMDPRIYADNSYDSLFIITKAVETARAKKIALKEALRETNYSGLAGNYTFNETNSFSAGSSSLVCVRDEKVELEK